MTEVIITSGANGGLNAFILAIVNDGDEVVLFEPTYPLYLDHVRMANGVIKPVPLEYKDNEWKYDPEVLRKTFSDKTKLFIFNNPNNPAGKRFSREEIEEISKILEEFPHVFVISDEVYDFLTFDDKEHLHFASFRNNYEKTLTLFSGGKLLNCTGWKIGWGIGPAKLVRFGGVLANAIFYCCNSPGQVAFARSLDKAWNCEY
jgi:aspartate/methionine/tyrosine aminotransferase